MKGFDIRTDISGARLVIYPGGSLAKKEANPLQYFDFPYIEVRKGHTADTADLVRGGQVQKTLYLPLNMPFFDPASALVELMKEL